jgi:pimeloyl-ACP methyl ester carboxylesterase
MLACLLRWGLTLELLGYSGGGLLLWHHGDLPAVHIALLALGLALGLRALVVATLFALTWRHRTAANDRLGLLPSVRLVFGEYTTFLLVFGLLHPLPRWFGRDRPATAAAPTQPPILLIHGYCCNSAYWWGLRRYLHRQGVGPVFSITLEPVFNDIEDFAAQLAARVAQIRARTGAHQVILIGHSMGGLVARTYLHHHGGASCVARLITLGSPHHGSLLARYSLTQATNVRQMLPGNDWLDRLNTAQRTTDTVPTVSIYSWHDNLVAPQTSAILNGSQARNIGLAGVGHLALGFSRRAHALVGAEIRAAADG